MIKSITKTAVVLATIALFTSCLPGGLPPPSARVPQGFQAGGIRPDESGVEFVRYVLGRGEVVGQNGRPLRDADVRATTSLGSQYIKTNAQGRFEVNIPVSEGEQVTFEITHGPKTGETLSKGFQVGVNVVLFHFRVLDSGKIILHQEESKN